MQNTTARIVKTQKKTKRSDYAIFVFASWRRMELELLKKGGLHRVCLLVCRQVILKEN